MALPKDFSMYPTAFLLRTMYFVWSLLGGFLGGISFYDAFVGAEEYSQYWKAQGPFAELWYYESAAAYYFVSLFGAVWGALGMAASVWYNKYVFWPMFTFSLGLFIWGRDILLVLWRLFVP